MDSISEKILSLYPGLVVRKDLSTLLRRSVNVPSFVLEYLLGVYCSTDDELALSNGLAKVQKILSENFVRPNESELIKYKIRDKGTYTVIDKLKAELSSNGSMYIGKFENLDLSYITLSEDMVKKNQKLLCEGIWVMAKIKFNGSEGSVDYEKIFKGSIDKNYVDKEDNKVVIKINKNQKAEKRIQTAILNPFSIVNIKPIQMATFDLDDFISKRDKFTTKEWIDLLLRSMGISPNDLNDKEKFHFLERVVPMIEQNYNLVELGPRGTGKSHVYKEITPYSILVSGGYASPSILFYNVNRAISGLVSEWDVVAFDEVSGMRLKTTEVIQTMKDYMASGSFVRGKSGINASASFVFIGNINDTVQNMLKTTTLFDPFPKEVNNDSAFFDRIHYYIPGWEVPKIRTNFITTDYGFINDAFSEFLKEMRKKDFTHILDGDFKFNSALNIRDEIGVRKTISGLMKLIFPNGVYTSEEAEIVVQYALEGRRRVKEQLKKMVGDEFADVNLGYYKKGGTLNIVSVPEKNDDYLINDKPLPCGHIYTIGCAKKSIYSLYRLENKIENNDTVNKQPVFMSELVKGDENSVLRKIPFLLNARSELLSYGAKNNIPLNDLIFYCSIRDINKNGIANNISIAEFLGLFSALINKPVKPSSIYVGNVSLTGVIDTPKDIADYIRVAANAGAKYLYLPTTAKEEAKELNSSIYNRVEIIYYNDIESLIEIAFEK